MSFQGIDPDAADAEAERLRGEADRIREISRQAEAIAASVGFSVRSAESAAEAVEEVAADLVRRGRAVRRGEHVRAPGFDGAWTSPLDRVQDYTSTASRALVGYTVPRAWQEGTSIAGLLQARWDRVDAAVNGFLERAQARVGTWQARLDHGWRSPEAQQARQQFTGIRDSYRQRVADARGRAADMRTRIARPYGRLGRIGRVAGPVGVATSAVTAVAGSPYDGTRGSVDRAVAGATAVAGAALLVGAAPVAAGAVVVAGTAWVVGNLAYDAWQNRKEIARRVSEGVEQVQDAISGALSAASDALGFSG